MDHRQGRVRPWRAQHHPRPRRGRSQFRDTESARLDGFEARRELVAAANRHGPVAVTMTAAGKPSVPTAMDEDFQRHLAAAAEAPPGAGDRCRAAPSHDAIPRPRVTDGDAVR
ncbi:MAG: hypothetical protein U1F68_03040 [Gammaproteobacteria bacterium]